MNTKDKLAVLFGDEEFRTEVLGAFNSQKVTREGFRRFLIEKRIIQECRLDYFYKSLREGLSSPTFGIVGDDIIEDRALILDWIEDQDILTNMVYPESSSVHNKIPESDFSVEYEFDKATGVGEFTAIAEEQDDVSQDSDFIRMVLSRLGASPETHEVVGSVRVSSWDGYDGRELYSYRAQVQRKNLKDNLPEVLDPSFLKGMFTGAVSAAENTRASDQPECTFLFHVADTQLGKADRDGSKHVMDTFARVLANAVSDYKVLSATHNIAAVQIAVTGDCIEGNVSQNGRNTDGKSLDLSITEQLTALGGMLSMAVQAFAPVAPKVYLDVVNGNHDEATRAYASNAGDGWATTAAKNIESGLRTWGGEAYDHVVVRVPEDAYNFMVVDTEGGNTMILTHGHLWKGGQLGYEKWWQQLAHNGVLPNKGILLFGHFHHPFYGRDGVGRTAICADTLESESSYFVNLTGSRSNNDVQVHLLRDNRVILSKNVSG